MSGEDFTAAVNAINSDSDTSESDHEQAAPATRLSGPHVTVPVRGAAAADYETVLYSHFIVTVTNK